MLRAGGFEREDLFISNRLWFEFFPDESFEAEVDGSLSRIGIDRFDLVFCYLPPEGLGPPELVERLAALIATGKVDYWASANWPVELLAECCRIAARTGAPLPTAAMVPYSVLVKSFVENEQASVTMSRGSKSWAPTARSLGSASCGALCRADLARRGLLQE